MKFKKVIIIGVGLIGGSLARDLLKKKITKEIIGFDTDKKNLHYAVKTKIVSRAGRSLKEELSNADLIILATPVLSVEVLIREISVLVPATTLVLDVGSTKKKIVQAADCYFKNGNFVGTHPMAGLEQSGAKASQNNLFLNSPCLIVKGQKTKKTFLAQTKQLWVSVGARVLNINIEDHDRYLAACSHLPHALSFALMRSVGRTISPQVLKKIAGNSFKSYTRISGSDAHMWTDIFIDNQKNTLAKINAFQRELKSLEKFIRNKDKKSLLHYMKKSAAMWGKM